MIKAGHGGFFRGSELPRLLILVGILIAGFPLCLMFARSDDEPKKAPPTTVLADSLTPIQPETSPAFQVIQDKTKIQSKETPAYAFLLEKARTTSPQELDKVARRDVLLTHLSERPEKYRGVPIHLTGWAKKIITYEVAPALVPTGRLFEVWFYANEAPAFPYALIVQDPPKGLEIGVEVDVPVVVDGYFLKQMAYQAGDKPRWAPLLIGRMKFVPPAAPAPGVLTDLKQLPRVYWLIAVMVVFGFYMAIRMINQIRRFEVVSLKQSRLSAESSNTLSPDELSTLISELPNIADDPTEKTDPD